jgi:hypothetical protein
VRFDSLEVGLIIGNMEVSDDVVDWYSSLGSDFSKRDEVFLQESLCALIGPIHVFHVFCLPLFATAAAILRAGLALASPQF